MGCHHAFWLGICLALSNPKTTATPQGLQPWFCIPSETCYCEGDPDASPTLHGRKVDCEKIM